LFIVQQQDFLVGFQNNDENLQNINKTKHPTTGGEKGTRWKDAHPGEPPKKTHTHTHTSSKEGRVQGEHGRGFPKGSKEKVCPLIGTFTLLTHHMTSKWF
jgi:hypothetical protein